MNNGIELVHKTDVPEMFSQLEHLYLQDLGIEIVATNDQITDPKMIYILRDPKKFAFLNHYHPGFILDPILDMPTILAEYSNEVMHSKTLTEVEALQKGIEHNRLRQSMFESDRESDAKADCVNLYLDRLYLSVIARHRQLLAEGTSPIKDRIQSIITAPNVHILYKKIIDFYQSEFGIGLYVQVAEGDAAAMQTVLRVDDNYKKLANLGIQTEKLLTLDSGSLMGILESYLKPMVANLDLEDLFKMGALTKDWHDHLDYQSQHDFELARFIGPLQDVIKEQLTLQIEALLEKPAISVHHITLIVNHLDLLTEQQDADDIERYLSTYVNEEERTKLENLPNETLRHLIQTEKITAYFQRIDQMELVGGSNDLLEACELKTYLSLLEMQKKQTDLGVDYTLSRLATPIALGLRQLLINYQADTQSTVSDRFKTKKLSCIQAMIDTLDNPKLEGDKKIMQIKVLFEQNPAIHKIESLGRFLYRCLCALVGKPCLSANYHMTLFKGFSAEDEPEKRSDFQSLYTKLKRF